MICVDRKLGRVCRLVSEVKLGGGGRRRREGGGNEYFLSCTEPFYFPPEKEEFNFAKNDIKAERTVPPSRAAIDLNESVRYVVESGMK